MKTLFFAGVFWACWGPATAEVTVSVAGLKVIGEGYQGENPDDELRPFNWTKGTSMALLLKSDDKSIVAFERENSKIATFVDDQGSDFMKARSRFSSKPYSFDMPEYSEDRKALMTQLESPGVPARGAVWLSVKGSLEVSVASESVLKKSAGVALKKGEKIEVDGRIFTIDEVGKPDWGDDPLEVVLKGPVDLKEFRKVIFYDAEGGEIDAEKGSWSSFGMFGKRTFQASFLLKKKIDVLNLGLEIWTDLEKVTVPLDLRVGAGL